jgi:hypothetical protein
MIHLLPVPEVPEADANAEALARIAGLRRALRLVDPFGGGPASDIDEDVDPACWAAASEGVKRCFDRRSERTIAGAAAGLEAVLAERGIGHEPHRASLELLAREIRAGLADLVGLVRSATPAPCPWA